MIEDESNSTKKDDGGKGKAISFHRAFLIPGVIEFSLCLFSAKLVFYVFLFWLPHYIKVGTGISTLYIISERFDCFQIQFESQHEPDSWAITGIANFFDYGAMLGGVLAGFLSDQTRGKLQFYLINIPGPNLSV